MLIKVTSKYWRSAKGENANITNATTGDVILFNGSHINGLLVRASTKSSFMFSENPYDYRAKADYVETESTVAAIKAMADATFQSMYVSLPLYPNNDLTQSPVTTLINCESIAFVKKNPVYPNTKTIIVYYEAGKRRKVDCSYSINQVYSLCDDGNLTT